MTPGERRSFVEALGVLGETFNEPVSELRAQGYEAALEDLDHGALLAAMRAALKGRFFPRPGELREAVLGSQADAAELAWTRLVGEVRRVGWCGVPSLEPADVAALRGIWGSWARLCETLPLEGTPEYLGQRKAFLGAYSASARQSEADALRLTPAFVGVLKAAAGRR